MQIGQFTPPGIAGGLPLPAGGARPGAAGGVPFSQLLSNFLSDMDNQQQAVSHDIDRLIAGEADNIHEVAITVAQADVSFRLFMEVRDQLINAYQEVMRMQV